MLGSGWSRRWPKYGNKDGQWPTPFSSTTIVVTKRIIIISRNYLMELIDSPIMPTVALINGLGSAILANVFVFTKFRTSSGYFAHWDRTLFFNIKPARDRLASLNDKCKSPIIKELNAEMPLPAPLSYRWGCAQGNSKRIRGHWACRAVVAHSAVRLCLSTENGAASVEPVKPRLERSVRLIKAQAASFCCPMQPHSQIFHDTLYHSATRTSLRALFSLFLFFPHCTGKRFWYSSTESL